MNRQTIKLTEKELHNLIKESVNRILTENQEDEGAWGKLKGGVKGIGNAVRGEFNKVKNGIMNNGLNNEYQGQNMNSRMQSAKNYIQNSAQVGDRKQEYERFIKQLDGYIQQGILGKKGTEAASTLKQCILQSMRGDKGRLTQNYNKNGYR